MKKLLLVVAGLALLTSACKFQVNMLVDVNQDGSGAIATEMGMDQEFLDLIKSNGGSPDDITSQFDTDLPGAKPYQREEGDFTYYGVRKEFDDITQAGEFLSRGGPNSPFESFSLTMDDRGTQLDAKVKVPSDLGGNNELGIDPSQLAGDFFTFRLVASLPGKVVEHDADEVLPDGRLVWNLPVTGGEKTIHVRTEYGGGSLGWLWILLAILVIVGVAAAIVAVLVSRRRSVDAVTEASSAFTAPAGDDAPTGTEPAPSADASPVPPEDAAGEEE